MKNERLQALLKMCIDAAAFAPLPDEIVTLAEQNRTLDSFLWTRQGQIHQIADLAKLAQASLAEQ